MFNLFSIGPFFASLLFFAYLASVRSAISPDQNSFVDSLAIFAPKIIKMSLAEALRGMLALMAAKLGAGRRYSAGGCRPGWVTGSKRG